MILDLEEMISSQKKGILGLTRLTSGSERTNFGRGSASFRLDNADSRPEMAKFRLKRADIKLQRAGTYKSTPLCYLRPLPKRTVWIKAASYRE